MILNFYLCTASIDWNIRGEPGTKYVKINSNFMPFCFVNIKRDSVTPLNFVFIGFVDIFKMQLSPIAAEIIRIIKTYLKCLTYIN